MKTKKLLFLSLATASLLSLPGCKLCDWLTPCCKKTQSTTHKKSRNKKVMTQAIVQLNTKSDFQALLQAEKPVVIKLYAAWCGACKEMEPTFQALALQLPEITFAELDIDHVSDVAQEYNIKGVPTFLMFKNGKEVSSDDRVLGVIEQEKFKEILESSLLK